MTSVPPRPGLVRRLRAWVDRMVDRRRRDNPQRRVELTSDGFCVGVGETERACTWREIREIVAYKIDRFAYDHVVVEVTTEGPSEHVTLLDEDMSGFEAWAEAVNRELEGAATGWLADVREEPFDPRRTTVYRKH